MRTFRSADGTEWGVTVMLPGSSNAMVVFRHPDGRSSHFDRYNWFISKGPEARSVTSRLSPERVLEQIDEVSLGRLFGRSMPVSRPAIEPNLALGLGGTATGHSRGIGKVDH
jgi:hypothetical protein